MISGGSDSPNLLQVIGPNRRISNVPVQKPQQNVQQQMSTVEQSSSQQPSPNQQTATPPQHSPQQVGYDDKTQNMILILFIFYFFYFQK